jgi:probable F420-dependent oxidoreductase
MKIGITLPQVGEKATRDNIIEFAKKADTMGHSIDSLWVLDRLLWPMNPQTPYRGTIDGRLPSQAQNVLDPIDLLTFAASYTKRIRLGTCVVDMLFQNPVILARRFATLDVISEGRVICCGLGIGWSKDEYQACNVPFKHRGKRAAEFVEVLKKIWTEEIIQFKGDFYNIPASKIGPKSVTRPYPPIYLGGWSSKSFLRIINNNTSGWIASLGGGVASLEYLEDNIRIFNMEITAANKDRRNFRIFLLVYPQINSKKYFKGGQRVPFTGTIDDIGGDIQKIKELGVAQMILSYFFSGGGGDADDVAETLNTTNELSRFAA